VEDDGRISVHVGKESVVRMRMCNRELYADRYANVRKMKIVTYICATKKEIKISKM
jgi:hypothetical protein